MTSSERITPFSILFFSNMTDVIHLLAWKQHFETKSFHRLPTASKWLENYQFNSNHSSLPPTRNRPELGSRIKQVNERIYQIRERLPSNVPWSQLEYTGPGRFWMWSGNSRKNYPYTRLGCLRNFRPFLTPHKREFGSTSVNSFDHKITTNGFRAKEKKLWKFLEILGNK